MGIKFRPSDVWSMALVNIAIILLVGFALYLTHSLWSFIALLFLLEYHSDKKESEV